MKTTVANMFRCFLRKLATHDCIDLLDDSSLLFRHDSKNERNGLRQTEIKVWRSQRSEVLLESTGERSTSTVCAPFGTSGEEL